MGTFCCRISLWRSGARYCRSTMMMQAHRDLIYQPPFQHPTRARSSWHQGKHALMKSQCWTKMIHLSFPRWYKRTKAIKKCKTTMCSNLRKIRNFWSILKRMKSSTPVASSASREAQCVGLLWNRVCRRWTRQPRGSTKRKTKVTKLNLENK